MRMRKEASKNSESPRKQPGEPTIFSGTETGLMNRILHHIIGDGKLNPIVGVYIPIIRIPHQRLDDHPQYKEFRPWLICIYNNFSLIAGFESSQWVRIFCPSTGGCLQCFSSTVCVLNTNSFARITLTT